MLKDKRALSTIVTTLIIILLVLVAIGIIWFVVRPVIEGGSQQIDIKAKCLNVDIRATGASPCTTAACTITIKRGLDNEDIDGIKVVVSDGSTSRTSDTLFDADFPNAGDTKTKIFTYATALTTTPQKVTVAAFFRINGVPELCTPQEYTI